MKLIKKSQKIQMFKNWEKETTEENAGEPVLKLFNPAGAATWLLTSMDPEDEDTMFGLCDLGMGCPELGTVSMSELAALETRVQLGPYSMPMKIERDLYFKATHPLRVYTEASIEAGRITEDEQHLASAARRMAEEDARQTAASATT